MYKNLKNVLVAVVRYFGGIKLGAGGLIRAYANGAKEVLDASGIKEQIACNKVTFYAEFSDQKKLQVLLKNIIILKSDTVYQQNIMAIVYVLPENISSLISVLSDCFGKEIQITTDKQIYYI